jgi:hypothetical protein
MQSPRSTLRSPSLVIALVLALLPGTLRAQIGGAPPQVIDQGGVTVGDVGPELEASRPTGDTASRKPTFAFAPVPFKNTQIGWGLMATAMVIHKFDSDPTVKPSTGMVGAFYTENGSWGVMVVEAAKLARDKVRLRLAYMHPEVRYNFYGIGEDAGEAGKYVQLQQNMNMLAVVALGRIAPNVYLGPSAVILGATVAVRDTSGLGVPAVLPDTANITLFAPGVQAEVDTRDSDYWPTHGTLAQAKAWFFVDALGGDRTFQRFLINWSWYTTLKTDHLIFAANLNTCGTHGDTPFWSLCAIGAGRSGLRGYTQGRYRDTVMTTEQVELRYKLTDRFGVTGFAGMGHVAQSLGDIFSATVLPAGGVGARYRLTRNYPMNLRLDYAWGRDDGYLYFGISEAF